MTGGTLKTTAQADKESLQAAWFDQKALKSVNLRARDVCPLIDIGRRWAGGKKYGGLPVSVGHVSSSLRLVLVVVDGTELLVLTRAEGGVVSTQLPVMSVSHDIGTGLMVSVQLVSGVWTLLGSIAT